MKLVFTERMKWWSISQSEFENGDTYEKNGFIQDGAIVCSVGISSTNLPCWNRLGVSNASDSDGFNPIFFFMNRTAAKVSRSYGMMVWYHFREGTYLETHVSSISSVFKCFIIFKCFVSFDSFEASFGFYFVACCVCFHAMCFRQHVRRTLILC